MPRKGKPPAPRFLAHPRELHGTLVHVDDDETINHIREARALCDEPESIGPAIVSYAETNKTYDMLRHAKAVEEAQKTRKDLTPEQRLATVIERARQQRLDIAQDVFVLRQQITSATKGGRRLPTVALTRLEKLEARLDGVTDLPIQRAS